MWLSNFDRLNQRSFNCYRDHASKRIGLQASIREIGVHNPYQWTASTVRPQKIGPVARREGAASYGVHLPATSRKSLQVPWAHLVRLDNGHTGAFIMNGSSVSILFSPPFILLAHLFLKLIRDFGPERAIFAYINHGEGVGTGIVFSRWSCWPPSPLPFGDTAPLSWEILYLSRNAELNRIRGSPDDIFLEILRSKPILSDTRHFVRLKTGRISY